MPLKRFADEALEQCPSIKSCLVVHRGGAGKDQQRAARVAGEAAGGAPEHEPAHGAVIARAHDKQVDAVAEGRELLDREAVDR